MIDLTVKRWGNSLALRIPTALADAAHIAEKSVLSADIRDGLLILEKKPTFSLAGLVAELEAGAKLEPVLDRGKPVGSEFASDE